MDPNTTGEKENVIPNATFPEKRFSHTYRVSKKIHKIIEK